MFLPTAGSLLVCNFLAGETCKQPYSDSLVLLKNTVEEIGYKYDCYDLFGSPDDPDKTGAVAACAANVIGKIQRGIRTIEL